MKSILVLCLSLLVGGISTQSTGRSNWAAVEEHVDRLQQLVYYSMYAIYADAYEDNPVVGDAIGVEVNNAAESGMDLLAIVNREVVGRNLTVPIARIHLGELLIVMTDLYAAIEDDLQDLSEGARTKIEGDFSYLFLHIPGIANDIYAALEEVQLSCGIVGLNNNETIYPESPLSAELPPGTEFWRLPIYSVHYVSALLHPHIKYIDSELTDNVEELWFATTADFPNFIGDTNLTSILRVLLFHCADGSNVLYEFEFPVEDGGVVEPTISPA